MPMNIQTKDKINPLCSEKKARVKIPKIRKLYWIFKNEPKLTKSPKLETSTHQNIQNWNSKARRASPMIQGICFLKCS